MKNSRRGYWQVSEQQRFWCTEIRSQEPKLFRNLGTVSGQSLKPICNFGNVDDNVEITRALENITENVKIGVEEDLGHYELKQHKPCFDEEISKLLYKREQVKVSCLQRISAKQ